MDQDRFDRCLASYGRRSRLILIREKEGDEKTLTPILSQWEREKRRPSPQPSSTGTGRRAHTQERPTLAPDDPS